MKHKEVSTLLPYNLQIFADEQPPQTPDPAPNGAQGGEPAADKPAEPQQKDVSPTPDTGDEVTLESLMAKMAKLQAENTTLKNTVDKLCVNEKKLKTQLQTKMTAEEAEAQANAEQKAAHEEYVRGLERKIAITDATNRYMEMGMDKKLANETAIAEVDDNKDLVNLNIKKYNDEWKKATEAAIRQEYLDQMPTPQSGNGTDVDYSKQYSDALNHGDQSGAVMAILKQAQATGQLNIQ